MSYNSQPVKFQTAKSSKFRGSRIYQSAKFQLPSSICLGYNGVT